MRKKLFTLALVFNSVFCFSQSNEQLLTTLSRFDSSLQAYAEKYPREIISAITDKTQYMAGDDIWISCLVTVDGVPSFISKVLYIELSDAAGKLLDKKMLPVGKGLCNGQITINSNWPSGVYYINAYTQWMRNFPDLILQKPIIIYNTDWLIKPVQIETNSLQVSNIDIFPEGHSLITGAPQKLIVRTTSKEGLPVKTNFVLLEDGKEISTARTNEYGIGEITFEPKEGMTYSVQSKSQEQLINSRSLVPLLTGTTLSVNNFNSKRIFVQVQRTENNKPSYNKLLLAGIMNNKVVYNGIIDFEEGSTAAAITRNKIPSGVLEILLMDEYQNIISSGKIYNPPAPGPDMIQSEQTPDRKTALLNLPDSVNILTHLSVTEKNTDPLLKINKIALLPELHREDHAIITSLTDSASLQLIDQLLIQHYSAPAYKSIINPTTVPRLQYMVESGITINGHVKQYAGQQGLKSYEAELIILGEDSTTMLAKAMTRENGEFTIPDANYTKSAKIYFQAHNPSNKKEIMNITLQPGYFDALKIVTIKPRTLFPVVPLKDQTLISSSPLRNKLEKTKETDPRYIVLQAVIIKAKKLSTTDSLKQEYMSPIFDDGNLFIIEPDGNYFNIWQLIRGRVPGLKVDGDINNPTVYFNRYSGIGGVTSQTDEAADPNLLAESVESIQFFLNEIPVSKDILSSLSVEDVALVTSNREPMPGLGASFGMISVYTKKGVSNTSSRYKSMAMEKRSGFSVTKNHFYEVSETDTPGKTVYRNMILPGSSKKIIVPVLKSKSYISMLMGWDKKGNLIIQEKFLE